MIALKGIEAMACSCAPISVSDSYAKMAAIFEGTVIDVKRATSSHYSPKIITLKVTNKYKGLDSEQEVVVRTAGMSASCGSQFDIGNTYLVYAYRNRSGSLETNLCTRTRQVSRAGKDVVKLEELRGSR